MRRLLVLVMGGLLGCESGAQVQMNFSRLQGLYSAPFPSDDLLLPDGHIKLDQVKNPNGVALIAQGLVLLNRDVKGFAQSSTIYLPMSTTLDETRLPDIKGSTAADSPIFLVSVDPAAPDFMKRHPVQIGFMAKGGPFAGNNLLSILPLQGAPLRPNTLYAAVVMQRLLDAQGRTLTVAPEVADLAAGRRPAGISDSGLAAYHTALTALSHAGVNVGDIAGLAAFTTGDPTADLFKVRADALARPLPVPLSKPVPKEVFDDYCVYQTTINMPDYQDGTPPFGNDGGAWRFDDSGNPILQRMDESNFFITVPRAPMPAAGYPVTVFVRTGGGGDRPLIDRGTQPDTGLAPFVPGSGPAVYFARAGFAGVQIDGPLGGLRNVTGADEQYLIFNVMNAAALRDNVRQSAVELGLTPHILATLEFDASTCPGSGEAHVKFDLSHLALMGHSTGAWIAQLVLASEPQYAAAILSGAGASWIENVMYKIKPLTVRPLAEALLDYDMDQRDLRDDDPALALMQWGAESADGQVYNRLIVDEPLGGTPRHVLMLQGIVDHYIMPQIAEATSLSLGLDLAGDPLDEITPELATQRALRPLLPFVGRQQITLPASGNRTIGGKAATVVVVQHQDDGIEDGHEVVFQTPAPKHQYQCFLRSFLAGTPQVPTDAASDAPCP